MYPVNKLLELCDDRSSEIRIAAAYALGEAALDDNRVDLKLMDMSDDNDIDVQIAAIKALGRSIRPRTK